MKSVYIKTSLLILTVCCLVFAILYVRMCFVLDGMGQSVSKNNRTVYENEQNYKEQLENMQQTIDLLKGRFHFVDVQDSADPHLAFHQIVLNKHQKRLITRLAENVKDPDLVKPEDLEQIYLYALSTGILPVDQLEIDPVSGRVMDRNAAVLEELCRRFRLKAETALLWDLRTMKRGTETRIFSPEHPEYPAAVVYSRSMLLPENRADGQNNTEKDSAVSLVNDPKTEKDEDRIHIPIKQNPDYEVINRCVRHDQLQTFVFPFDLLNILTSGRRDIILPGGEVPLGNLYVHYYSVYSNEPWTLSYEFYDRKKMKDAGFRVVNLLADSHVEMEQKKSKLILRVTPNQYNRASFLVTADKTLIPHSAQAECIQEESDPQS